MKNSSSEQFLFILRATPKVIALNTCLGWELVGGRYKWLSVGYEYTSVVMKLSAKCRVTSKTLRWLSRNINLNLLVG